MLEFLRQKVVLLLEQLKILPDADAVPEGAEPLTIAAEPSCRRDRRERRQRGEVLLGASKAPRPLAGRPRLRRGRGGGPPQATP